MKLCPMCGREYPDYKSFCDIDQTPLSPVTGPASISELGEPESVTPNKIINETTSEESSTPIETVSDEELPVYSSTETMALEGSLPFDDDEETVVRPKEESTVEFREEQIEDIQPVHRQPSAMPPNYGIPPMPPPPQSNPWKLAFFSLLGLVAISAILFFVLGRNPNANTNNPGLNIDPNANAMQPGIPPTGTAENMNGNPYPQNINSNGNTNLPPYPPYPPYPEVNMNGNANTNINTNVNANANANVKPSPKNTNANANVNTNTNTNTNANVRPSPSPKPSATPAPSAPPSPKPTTQPSATPF